MEVWPLVVDVDTTGYVTVLYPRQGEHGAEVLPGGTLARLGKNGVNCVEGCGVEFLKAFAFRQRPIGYESWSGKSFAATDPQLRDLVRFVAQGVGETVLRVITNPKE